jgi:hypothetical protein
MKIHSVLLTSAAVLFCTASMSATTSLHTWVSGSGNDSNACTFASPCATFTGALAKTTAGGIITAKDAGDFGAVTITQSVTIDGANMGSVGFGGDSEGIYIAGPSTTTAINVVIHNLTIDGQGTGSDGIFLANAGNLTIDNCKIEGFTQIGIGLGSEGVENVVIRDTVIDGGGIGTLGVRTFQSSPLATPNDFVSLQNVTIKGMTQAAVFSRDGVLEISNSVLTQSGVAVQVDTSATISVESSMLTMNTTAVCSYTASTIRLSNNDIFDNGTGIEACGGTVATNGNNRKGGNPGTGGTVGVPNATVNVQ